ncbi:MAG: hypothetical protein KF894_14060 [Labilithrix sp.]|nr:hypothetical protein [Labilithrix sp.]
MLRAPRLHVLACGVVLFSPSCGLLESESDGAAASPTDVGRAPMEPAPLPPATGWGDVRVMSIDGTLAMLAGFEREPPAAGPPLGPCRLGEIQRAREIASQSAGAITLGVGEGAAPAFTFEPAEYMTGSGRGTVAPTPPVGTSIRIVAKGAEVPAFDVSLVALADVKLAPQEGASLDREAPLSVRWESGEGGEGDNFMVSLVGKERMASCWLEPSAKSVVVPRELVRAVAETPGTHDCDDCLGLHLVMTRRAEVRAGEYAVVARYETYASETLKLR